MLEAQSKIENIKPEILQDMLHTARTKTWDAVYAIKNLVQVGMTETEAVKKANAYLASMGVRKFWHKTHVRFGQSTILGFDDAYVPDVTLKENDIFYVDIGPVWGNVEGDCGATFVVGENAEYLKITEDVKELFFDVQKYWQQHKVTGQKLFTYAEEKTQKMGYVMHPSYVKGHRLSEFSHQIYTNMNLFDTEFYPSPERWVLELQICHASLKFGAFYEDIL